MLDTLGWSANTGNAVVFIVKLGGPHERAYEGSFDLPAIERRLS